MLPILIFWSVTLFALFGCLLAFWKGGAAERLAAGVIVLNVGLGFGAIVIAPNAVEAFRIVNDGLAAMALLAVALRYASPWLGGAMLLYAAQFSLHSYYLVMGEPSDTALHATINNLNFTSIIVCVIAGTVVTWRRRIARRRANALDGGTVEAAP